MVQKCVAVFSKGLYSLEFEELVFTYQAMAIAPSYMLESSTRYHTSLSTLPFSFLEQNCLHQLCLYGSVQCLFG